MSYGKLQPLEVPVWKWEHITMNLVTKLPKTPRQHDAIWVIVDRLIKSEMFLPIKEASSSETMSKLTSVCWGGVGQRELGSTEIVLQTTKMIDQFSESLKMAQDQKKSYADRGRSPIEFQVGDKLMLKDSHWKCIINFRKRGKLGPRYMGPFKIISRVGKIAYRLALPEESSAIHDTLHMSQLRKCLADESTYVPLDDIEVDEKLRYAKKSVKILDQKTKQRRNKR
ncbi:uncharacterized protein [Rutidosis leptorrhynchoides]|uniref:uncharacterized protein n=1 Tax=Rutidosis leptorrhynchoides TaxID=125765 RepID=UPI003A99FB4F